MSEKKEIVISGEVLAALSTFTVRELLNILLANNALTQQQADDAVVRAANHLQRMTIGLTVDQTEDLIGIFLGRKISLPQRQLN